MLHSVRAIVTGNVTKNCDASEHPTASNQRNDKCSPNFTCPNVMRTHQGEKTKDLYEDVETEK